jgi:hypothetical protein
MKRKQLAILIFTAALALAGASLLSSADADEAAIRQACLNYADSAYLVKPELIDESVHPKVQKVGYICTPGQTPCREAWMNHTQLRDLVAGWNKNGRFDPKTAKREVKILDRLDLTAVARLDAEWGVDFFHLAKIDGRWQILNVIWQTYPQPAAAAN